MEDEYVEEACFYLNELEIEPSAIATEFNMTAEQVKNATIRYRKKIDAKQVTYDEEVKSFWAKNLRESTGDEKITLVDDKGRFYHGWKSEIEKMSTENLVELLVVNKQYSDRHPLSEFSKTQPIVGYDPIVPLRNIRRTVSLIDEILQTRAEDEEKKETKN
ncbi:MAG: hypothetical protein M1587_00215 [Thaumarchaeota archaeon]|nr:hypothetical protein [Nitrososphaerota archaeon]